MKTFQHLYDSYIISNIFRKRKPDSIISLLISHIIRPFFNKIYYKSCFFFQLKEIKKTIK